MKYQLSPKARNIIKSLIAIFLPVFSILFLVSTTAVIIIVMQGYSIDISKKEIIKTGVLNVETHPEEASIIVNSQYYGKSNKAIPNLRVGTYTVTLDREGYFTYKRKVTILHGLASPVIAPLIRDNTSTVLVEETETIKPIFQNTHDAFYVLTEIKGTSGRHTYTVEAYTAAKSFFDDPEPKKTQILTVTSIETIPVISYSVSPSGKNILFTLEDTKTKTKFISVVPVTTTTSSINLNLTENKSLTHYAKDKNTTITWAKDADYLLVQTASQIISYNISSGTRIILLEKDTDGNTLWEETETGISILRKTGGTEAPVFELSSLSFNGNPLDVTIPLSITTLKSQPTALWTYTNENELPIHIINTPEGAYLVGNLYSTKTGEYAISTSSQKVGDIDITHFENIYSLIKISTTSLPSKPVYLSSKFGFAYLEGNTSLTLFYYNKRAADALTELGKHTLYEADSDITNLGTLSNDYYVSFRLGTTLYVTDLTGENTYKLTDILDTFILTQNDTAMFFTTTDKKLNFRVIQ